MSNQFWALRCKQGESAVECIERAKLTLPDGLPLLPMDAYKGAVKRDRFGSMPAPFGVKVIGEVAEHGSRVIYYICQPNQT